MPRVNLGLPNYEKRFGDKIRGAVFAHGKCKDIAKKIGIGDSTMTSRFKNPGKMPLSELKLFIRLGGITEDDILDYLYERKEQKK